MNSHTPTLTSPYGTFEWNEHWVRIPDSDQARENGRTHGVAITSSGNVLVFHQACPSVLTYSPQGQLIQSWGEYPGAHGMTLVVEEGVDYLWLTDQFSGKVVKTTLDGKEVQSLDRPDDPIYAERKYAPTWVAVNETRHGGNGDIWLADGYGAHVVHRFNQQGRHLSTINGTQGAGLFKCPHGIAIDRRKSHGELYVADRGNKRVQVFDLNGKFIRSFGEHFLSTPDCFAFHGQTLIIPELHARITILDGSDELVCHLGSNVETVAIKGWPNHPSDLIQTGKFNSPHGLTIDPDGNIYVVEWIIGGRIIKLAKMQG